MKSLKITIAGNAACGKTTVARVIEDALKRHGMIVDVNDPDHSPTDSVDFAHRIPNLHGKKVTVEMVQTPRVEQSTKSNSSTN